jgi:hypothetical protein
LKSAKEERIAAAPFLANVLPQFDLSGQRRQTVREAPSLRPKVCSSKECLMEFKDHDSIWNPIVQNLIFFLESKCAFCGFSIQSRSIEELVEHEKLHRTQCGPSNAAV